MLHSEAYLGGRGWGGGKRGTEAATGQNKQSLLTQPLSGVGQTQVPPSPDTENLSAALKCPFRTCFKVSPISNCQSLVLL